MRLLTLGILLLLPSLSHAAPFDLTGSFESVSQNAFSFSVAPSYPQPFGEATVSFLSSSLDLANATLDLSVGKTRVYSGAVKPTRITLGKPGVPVTVTATITSNKTRYTQTKTIQPQEVSLIVEPVASVPPLYLGKASVPLDGSSRIVAIANFVTGAGKRVDPTTLSYTWSVDGTTLAGSSGIGKTSLIVASPLQFRSRTVSLDVTSQDGSLVGGGSVSLSPEAATLLVYEQDPLLGIRFDHALGGSYSIQGAESTLYAAPYSAPLTSGVPTLAWFLNGEAAQTGSTITLRPTGNGKGTASLKVTATLGSGTDISKVLSLTFGSTANFFGL